MFAAVVIPNSLFLALEVNVIVIVISHSKQVNVSYRMYFEVMESFGLILCDVH